MPWQMADLTPGELELVHELVEQEIAEQKKAKADRSRRSRGRR